MSGARRDLLWTGAVFLVVAFLLAGATVLLCGGRFEYTLDDPYIHLSLAENLARGHYGVNAEEACSPSSSILWPFLLAPLARVPAGDLFPLFLNLLFSLLAVLLAASLLREEGLRRAPLLALLLALGTGLWAVALTGMEHSLQLLLASAALAAALRERRTGKVPGWGWAALAFAPLVRYESLALTLPLLAYLFWRGRRRGALTVLAFTAASLGAFSLFLLSLGETALPTSVIAKSASMQYLDLGISSASPLAVAGQAWAGNLSGTKPLAFLLPALLLLLAALRRGEARRRERALAGIFLLALAALLTLGRVGWHVGRYEAFWLFPAWLLALTLHRDRVAAWSRRPLPAAAALLLFLALAFPRGVLPTAQAPWAARNIHLQHFQLHRFLTGWWKAPAGVNDLGWTSFRNDRYVLDLWGLGFPRGRFLRQILTSVEPQRLNPLAERRGVELLAVYDDLAARARENGWTEVGSMAMAGPLLTAGQDHVTFLAHGPAAAARARSLLSDFALSLPAGATLTVR